jgi:Tol biopolymer transport system component
MKLCRSLVIMGSCLCLNQSAFTQNTMLGEAPSVFAPGVISGPAHEASPAFSPDGRTVLFSRGNTSSSTILESHFVNGQWTPPTIASFSGEWEDMEPAMSPDGTFLLFISNRPRREGERPMDGFFNGKAWPGRGTAIWRVDRLRSHWGVPHILPDLINSTPNMYAPSVAGDGSIYFMRPDGPEGRFRLYRSQWNCSSFDTPLPLPFSDGSSTDVDPVVAPDESFLIFGSSQTPARGIDLFIVFHRNGEWQHPESLGNIVNSAGSDAEPRLSPDLRTLYFSSDRVATTTFPQTRQQRMADLRAMDWNNSLYNIWQTSLSPWLKGQDRPATRPSTSRHCHVIN